MQVKRLWACWVGPLELSRTEARVGETRTRTLTLTWGWRRAISISLSDAPTPADADKAADMMRLYLSEGGDAWEAALNDFNRRDV